MSKSKTSENPDQFPILCETCLGPNPYVRMEKQAWGTACKICERPFTCFRWRPAGGNTRPKKTEICQTCARGKNVCQTCILDLQYGLPVQVRDASIAKGDRQRTVVPLSDGTREYAVAQSERAIATGQVDQVYNAPAINNVAEKAKRTQPKYERNRTRICTFFLRGKCTRGLYCPYRHEKPPERNTKSKADEQNIRDRYYGVNDPVARKILHGLGVSADGKYRRLNSNGKGNNANRSPPEDKSVKSVFIAGITANMKEADLHGLFSEVAVPIRTNLLADKGIGFCDFESREDAESVMKVLFGAHEIHGERISVSWARSQNAKRPRSPVTESKNDDVAEENEKNNSKDDERVVKRSKNEGAETETNVAENEKG